MALLLRRQLLPLLGGAIAGGSLPLLGQYFLPSAPLHSSPFALKPWWGVNLIETARAPFDSKAARRSFSQLKNSGATGLALVPFLWQEDIEGDHLVYGDALPLTRLEQAILLARQFGLQIMLKPHIWIAGHWAGAINPAAGATRQNWFEKYQTLLLRLATLAQEYKLEALVIGTELTQLSRANNWWELIARIRQIYRGALTYAAHWDGEAEHIAFWPALDAIGVSLYPPLGEDPNPKALQKTMEAYLQRLITVRERFAKPLWVIELGLRSAVGAQIKPWESAEERPALVDSQLQYHVLALWVDRLRAYGVHDILFWRWFSDPEAGGLEDTDFTLQGKPSQRLLHR
jgi:hypothetical protein